MSGANWQFFQVAQKWLDARHPQAWGMRRTWQYAAMTKDKDNAADGHFSATC